MNHAPVGSDVCEIATSAADVCVAEVAPNSTSSVTSTNRCDCSSHSTLGSIVPVLAIGAKNSSSGTVLSSAPALLRICSTTFVVVTMCVELTAPLESG